MRRILFILAKIVLILISTHTHAYDYDPLLIRAQASIFPKIILLDKDLNRKIENNQIIIEILHTKIEKDVALNIKSLIENKYKSDLGNRRLIININSFESFDPDNIVTAYFILKGSSDIHNKVTSHAANTQRLVFSYDYKDFERNVLISVLMKEKTYIYLNKSAIHDYDIKFLPLFYKIVKVIE